MSPPVNTPQAAFVDRVVSAVGAFPGVSVHPHRFGGREFRLASREIGHVHPNGFVDVHFPRALRDALVESDRAAPHHLYPDSGWTTVRVTIPSHVPEAVAVLRISYLWHAAALSKRDDSITPPDLDAELADLDVTDAVREAFEPVV